MYGSFAYIYDRLMEDVDYGKWANYMEKIFKVNSLEPELVLDLGCGTGSLCVQMASRGYDMIGIDRSLDMLNCARDKTEEAGVEVLYLNQDMTDFELYGTVDAIVCLMDSINYITDNSELERVFNLVKNYLNPQGLFIFDINSCYKFENILGENVFYSVEDDITYIWENRYDRTSKVCEFDLTFFVKDSNIYRRYDELHKERAYSVEEITKLLKESGMKLKDVYGHMSLSPPHKESERIFFVCGKY